ncbi:MAG TPA: GNAT family N-acetyltransferase [Bacillota bacterium]|nr:GNAT family N-acetyltransferase [Sedimentibacter sp.]HHY99868.1 GNAT family N-acetyltransferase [Tissierellia bacterium]HOK48966.1 GNAT family N-acetyltransferase [Sedimentibacter sp.]HOO12018.1 GNAT family N-acetyltransferase [Bacillota bacterium]
MTTEIRKIRPATPEDYEEILKLNEESVHFLSPLSKEKLIHLHQESEILKVVETDGKVEAFVLALREGKDYDSVNYAWFSKNYEKFLYIDRVVASVKQQGSGLGKMLYEDVFKHAKSIDVPVVTAEIDIEPPNPVSLKFHEKFGFKEVGKQAVAGGKKIVSLQAVQIAE